MKKPSIIMFYVCVYYLQVVKKYISIAVTCFLCATMLGNKCLYTVVRMCFKFIWTPENLQNNITYLDLEMLNNL